MEGVFTVEDKIINMLETIAVQVTEMNKRLTSVESEMKEVKQSVLKTNIKIENDIQPKITALFDGYKANTEKLEVIENKVDKIAETVTEHDLKFTLIKNKRKAN